MNGAFAYGAPMQVSHLRHSPYYRGCIN